jgi:hypothetical protein
MNLHFLLNFDTAQPPARTRRSAIFRGLVGVRDESYGDVCDNRWTSIVLLCAVQTLRNRCWRLSRIDLNVEEGCLRVPM